MESSCLCFCNFSQSVNALKELACIGSACLLLKKKSKAKDLFLILLPQRQGDICKMGGILSPPVPPRVVLPLPKTQGNILKKIVLFVIMCVLVCLYVCSCEFWVEIKWS